MWARGGRPDPCLHFPGCGTERPSPCGPFGLQARPTAARRDVPGVLGGGEAHRGDRWDALKEGGPPQLGCGRHGPGCQHRPPSPEGSVAPLSAPRSPAQVWPSPPSPWQPCPPICPALPPGWALERSSPCPHTGTELLPAWEHRSVEGPRASISGSILSRVPLPQPRVFPTSCPGSTGREMEGALGAWQEGGRWAATCLAPPRPCVPLPASQLTPDGVGGAPAAGGVGCRPSGIQGLGQSEGRPR